MRTGKTPEEWVQAMSAKLDESESRDVVEGSGRNPSTPYSRAKMQKILTNVAPILSSLRIDRVFPEDEGVCVHWRFLHRNKSHNRVALRQIYLWFPADKTGHIRMARRAPNGGVETHHLPTYYDVALWLDWLQVGEFKEDSKSRINRRLAEQRQEIAKQRQANC